MNRSNTVINQKDNHNTKLYLFETKSEKPKASILIFHGMAEHHKRYGDFTTYLTENGFDVYLYDHRGHGIDNKKELGFFGNKKGHKIVVEDAIRISNYVRSNMRTNQFFLISHSMGSLIARNVIQQFDEFNGVIIMGSTLPNRLLTSLALGVGTIQSLVRGKKHKSKLMDSLLFGGSQYKSLNTKTNYDWLTSNPKSVTRYMADPYCGFICTTSFYTDLIRLTQDAGNKSKINQTRKDLPILFISGDKDAVSSYGKEIIKLKNIYNELGFSNTEYKLYNNARHELLNEVNKEVVYDDIINWLYK